MTAKTHIAIPVEITAFRWPGGSRKQFPDWMTDYRHATVTSGVAQIGKDAVGQLLVPVAGSFKTCQVGGYVVLHADDTIDVFTASEFEARFAPIDNANSPDVAPAPVAEPEAEG